MLDGIPVAPERVVAARGVAAVLTPGRRVALTTHVNADGDGVGSEVALWHLLTARGLRAAIANPTPIPERFHFLVPNGADHSERATREIESADVVVVLDVSDASRLGELARGVEPESIYASVYASAPEGRVRLMTEVLETLVVEPDHGLAWVTVPPDALQRHGATADDLDGIVEYPRSIAGVRLALLFRQLANGNVKVSFRSLGDVDVAELAAGFGGGGQRQGAGAAAREYLNGR